MSPLIITLKTATVATGLTFILGIMLAQMVSRLKRFRGIADAVIMLPMVLPPTVVGFFLLVVLGKRSPIGRLLMELDISLVFSWEAAVISAVVVSMPLMYRTVLGSIEQIDGNIISAARTLGVTEWKIFWRVILPNIKGGILAGLVLSYTRAMGEFGATIMFAGNVPNKTQTLSVAIYAAVQANDYDLAFKWAVLLAIISLVFIYGMNSIINRRRI